MELVPWLWLWQEHFHLQLQCSRGNTMFIIPVKLPDYSRFMLYAFVNLLCLRNNYAGMINISLQMAYLLQRVLVSCMFLLHFNMV